MIIDELKTNCAGIVKNVCTVNSSDNQADELYEFDVSNIGKVFACVKEITFGGRSSLDYENRVQIHSSSNNYILNKRNSGDKAIIIGIKKQNGETIICAFKPEYSSAKSTISKQIKDETINAALSFGFSQQKKGDVFACAFKTPFFVFYLNNLDWIHDCPIKDMNKHTKTISLQSYSPLILYGPPGTGKTYKMQTDYINNYANDRRFITTFHQSFSYEEFVEGLKPIVLDKDHSVINYEVVSGVFYNACDKAANLAGYKDLEDCIKDADRKQKMAEAMKDKDKIVLLCIDEINRANVSAVFGDLISLIETNKRIGSDNEMTVILPYSKKIFGVPANLLIVGTMNTADRSIQLLDSALRRRFKFEELLPDYSRIEYSTAREILKSINARIRCLLDKDHQIGHSYFIDAKDELDIFNALKDCVIPLLEEYFYNDVQKIRQILNEKGENEYYFYRKDADAMAELDNMQTDFDNERELFILNPELSEVKDDVIMASDFIKHIK